MPRGYYPEPSYGRSSYGRPSPATDIIMHRGQAEADAHLRSGDVWAGLFSSLGERISGALQTRDAKVDLKKRDKAWVSYVESGEWQKDPNKAYGVAKTIWGPDADKQMQSLVALQKMGDPKITPEEARKSLGLIGQGLKKMGDGAWKRWWPALTQLGGIAFPGAEIPGEFTPELRAEVEPMLAGLLGQPDGFTLSQGQTRFGPDGQPIAEVAPKPADVQPFTLSPGEVRYGPDGQPLASRPGAPKADTEPLMAVVGDDGQPVYLPRSQAVGRRPASDREQGRPVTSGDARRIAELDTSLDDLAVLRGTVAKSGATGTSARIGAALPNVITEWTGVGADAKSKQAVIDRVKQVIGKALEGGVLRKEDEYKYTKILPTIGDVPEVVEAKLAGLEQAITLRRQRELEARADAGYDVSRFEARERGAGPRGGPPTAPPPGGGSITVTTPDGQTFTFTSKAQADAFRKRAGIQ
jgi:hypothetical protein